MHVLHESHKRNAFFGRSQKEVEYEDEMFFRHGYCSHRIHRQSRPRDERDNSYVDVDEKGNIVSMTIEHARANAGLWEFSYQKMSGQAAQKMQNPSFEKDVSYDGASLEPISIGVI